MNSLYRNEAIEEAILIDPDIILNMMREMYEKRLSASREIDPDVFDAVWSEFRKAVTEGYGSPKPADPRFDFYQALQRSTAVFSAFKVHRMQNDMAARMIDEDGKLKPFKKWVKDVAPIADHQVGSWLRTEYDTAVKRAHMAADWQRFEADADLFPNLEWLPSTSINPRPEHMIFYGLVLPIHHPFWRENFPGDLWGCKCDVQATDALRTPEADIPAPLPQSRAAKGLDKNPAHTGEIFTASHPYYTEAFDGAEQAVRALMDEVFPDYADVKVEPSHAADYTSRIKELRKLARSLRDEPFRNEDFGHDIFLSKDGIGEYLNQPHRRYVHKNELLLKMRDVIRNAKYVGHHLADEKKKERGVSIQHFFEIRLLGEKNWIIVNEMKWGGMWLYGISDSPKVLLPPKK